MCGIIFSANFGKTKEEPSNEWIVNQYQDQVRRGTNGFGVVFIQPDGTYKITRACEQTKILMDIYHKDNQAPIILMHHRFPTSSENKMMETHPIEVDNGSLKYKYLMVHNGIINSTEEIKKEHEELGFIYTTERKRDDSLDNEFNDSECLAIELSRLIEKQTDKIKTNGSMAFIVLQIDREKNKIIQIFFGRDDGTPLKMSKTQNKIRLSSEGEGNNIEALTLYSCDLIDFKLKKEKFIIAPEDWSGIRKIYPANRGVIQEGDEELEEEETEEITTIEELFEKIEEQREEKNDTIDDIVEQHLGNIEIILNGLKGELMRYNDITEVDDLSIKNNIEKEFDKIIENAEIVLADYNASLETLKEMTAIMIVPPKQTKGEKTKQTKVDTKDDHPKSFQEITSIHSIPLSNPLKNQIIGPNSVWEYD